MILYFIFAEAREVAVSVYKAPGNINSSPTVKTPYKAF